MNAASFQHPVRINERLEAYWQELRTGDGLPLESQIDPSALADIWDSCFLLRVDADAKEAYTYVMLGKALIAAYGDDWTGKSVCEALLFPHPKSLFDAFGRVAASKMPVMDAAEFANATGVNVKYRSCLLPLAREGSNEVAYILGGMKWKAF